MARKKKDMRIEDLRCRLQSVAEQAVLAKRFRPDDDRLLDLIDDIDNDLQAIIALVNSVRRNEVGGEL
jgi:hypothetical protein